MHIKSTNVSIGILSAKDFLTRGQTEIMIVLLDLLHEFLFL